MKNITPQYVQRIPSLGEYLRAHLIQDVVDFSIRARFTADDTIEFYIHPTQESSDTQDFTVVCLKADDGVVSNIKTKPSNSVLGHPTATKK